MGTYSDIEVFCPCCGFAECAALECDECGIVVAYPECPACGTILEWDPCPGEWSEIMDTDAETVT